MTSEVSIPANGAVVSLRVGRYRYSLVRTAASPFRVSFDGGGTYQLRRQNDRDEPTRTNETLYFRAENGVAVEVTIETSESEIKSQATEITGTVSSTLVNNIADNIAVVPLQFAKVGNVANAVALSAAALYFRWCLLIAQRDLAGAANTANVRIGFQGGANQQPIVLAPGDQYVIPIPTGAKVDFQNVWLKITDAGDGVVAIYF